MNNLSEMVDFSLRNSKKLNQICEPLKTSFGVSAFWYSKTYTDGSFFSVGTHASSHEDYYKEMKFQYSPFCRKPEYLDEGFYLYRNYQDEDFQEAITACAKQHKVEFCATTIAKTESGFVRFGYGMEPGKTNNFQQNFLNNLPLFKKFNDYFIKESKIILKNIEDNLINLPEAIGAKYFKNPASFGSLGRSQKLNFLKSIGVDMDLPLVNLTKRESQLIKFILNGHSAGYIAKELSISQRTVENYLSNMKDKFNCCTKTELINKAKEYVDLSVLQGV